MEKTHLKRRVMRRVYGIWFMRSVLPVLALEVGILVVGIGMIGSIVFVEKVIANALTISVGNPVKFLSYSITAFMSTTALTQAILILLVVGGVFLLRDIYRSTVSYTLLKHTSRAVA
jgi:hypothetical protein